MSGGGNSGEIGFPDHMEEVHKDWLGYDGSPTAISNNIVNAINNASLSAPYQGYEFTDPSTFIDEVDTEVGELQTKVNALDEEADYDSIVDNAVAKVDEAGVLEDVDTSSIVTAVSSEVDDELTNAIEKAVDAIDDDTLKDIVEEFDKRSQYSKARATRRFAGSMSAINAVQSSAFLFGMALIEAEHVQSVNEFNKELTHQAFQDTVRLHVDLYRQRLAQEIETEIRNKTNRDQMLQNSVQLTAQMLQGNVQFKQALSELLTEVKRIEIVAKQEYEAVQLDTDVSNAEWDAHLVADFGGQLLGAIGGGTRMPSKPSKAGSAIGGALSGAAAGAQVGSISATPFGTAAGAGLGFLGGLGAALLN